MTLERAREIADAVLMEGYALYPYRASAPKNRYRWTFGTLAPRAWSEAGGCEPWWLEAQILVAGEAPRVTGELRGFQIERRQESLMWDEGVLQTITLPELDRDGTLDVTIAAGKRDDQRERRALWVHVRVRHEPIVAARPLARIAIRIENVTPWLELGAPREHAIASALASTHLVLSATEGALLSAIDPPAWAAAVAKTCKSVRTYPVLVGGHAMLCAPFILYDHPTIAPESAGDLCDACEIDELLMLRTRALTDAEKAEARATDPRAAAIIDRAEALPDEQLARMHGASRAITAGEMVPRASAAEVGRKVRLRRSTRRTDAQDLLYEGHVATIVDVKQDIDGSTFYAVTIDDDPAAELHDWYGRYHYYRDDEVDLL